MLKLYLFIMFSGILYNFVVGIETNGKEKIYYRQTELTAAVKPESTKRDILAIAMEDRSGLPKFIKLNSAKINSIRETAKKGSKTVPRKGVLNTLNDGIENNDTRLLNTTSENLILKKTKVSHIVITPNVPFINSTKILMSTEKSSTLHVAPVNEAIKEESIIASETKRKTKKPKPKPEVTVGEKEADEPIPAAPINLPIGIPRKIDYIVPVIITLTALPLFGAAFYVLYKRGRDYWDKRHYRRMDFLIDGMYNE